MVAKQGKKSVSETGLMQSTRESVAGRVRQSEVMMGQTPTFRAAEHGAQRHVRLTPSYLFQPQTTSLESKERYNAYRDRKVSSRGSRSVALLMFESRFNRSPIDVRQKRFNVLRTVGRRVVQKKSVLPNIHHQYGVETRNFASLMQADPVIR